MSTCSGSSNPAIRFREAAGQSRELIRETIEAVEMHAITLHAERGLAVIREALAQEPCTDAAWLRQAQSKEQFLPEVVRQQCVKFEGGDGR